MSKTVRKFNPRAGRHAFEWDARKRHMFLKGVKSFRSDKCYDAAVDGDGNTKLNTWSETPCKVGAIATRKIRRAHRIVIARQLEDA